MTGSTFIKWTKTRCSVDCLNLKRKVFRKKVTVNFTNIESLHWWKSCHRRTSSRSNLCKNSTTWLLHKHLMKTKGKPWLIAAIGWKL